MTHDKNYEATQYAIQVAKDNGCLISFDPNLRLSLWKTPEEARRRILYGMKQCDIMKISEEEVAFVSEQESLEKGVSFIRDNSDIKILFVTLGNKGSIAYYKDEKILSICLLLIAVVAQAQIQEPVKFKSELKTLAAGEAEIVFTATIDKGLACIFYRPG